MFLTTLLLSSLFAFPSKDTIIPKKHKELQVPVTIQYAPNAHYNLLVLPGYGYSDIEWCAKTSLCEKAKKLGFNLIFIEVQKSLYLKQYYPQTAAAVKKYPTRTWIVDTALNELFVNKLLNKQIKTFVLGLSTGARGAAILMLENPTIFAAAACLSGDYDPSLQKNDPLMINALGSYANNAQYWQGDNNITLRAKEFKNPLFIAHGMQDKVVPVEQSILLKDKLLKENPRLLLQYDFPPKGQHDYAFWNAEIDKLLAFFMSIN
jgi:dienelactone hydrolase